MLSKGLRSRSGWRLEQRGGGKLVEGLAGLAARMPRGSKCSILLDTDAGDQSPICIEAVLVFRRGVHRCVRGSSSR